jgi:hypothetical protein
MARSAIFGAYKDELRIGWRAKVRAWFELKRFDFVLAYDRFTRWLSRFYIRVLVKTGRIQASVLDEISQSFETAPPDYNH